MGAKRHPVIEDSARRLTTITQIFLIMIRVLVASFSYSKESGNYAFER